MKQLTTIVIAAALGVVLSGCMTAMQQNAQQHEELLTAAGFSVIHADTSEKMSRLKKLPFYEVGKREKDGKLVYYYADPHFCQCAYIGDESNYQAYHKLLVENKLRAGPVAVTPEDMKSEEEWRVLGSQ